MKRVGAMLACAIWLILSAPSAAAGSAPATGEATAAAPKPPTVELVGDTTLTDQDQALLTAVITNPDTQQITVSVWANAGQNSVQMTIGGKTQAYPQTAPAAMTIPATSVVMVPVTVAAGEPVRVGTTTVTMALLVTGPPDAAAIVTTSKDLSIALSTTVLVPGLLGISSALLVPGLFAIYAWLLVRNMDSRNRKYSVTAVTETMWNTKSYLLLALVISLVLAYLLATTRISLPLVGVVDLFHSATLGALLISTAIGFLLGGIGSAVIALIRAHRYPVVTESSTAEDVLKAMAKHTKSMDAASYLTDDARGLLLLHERGFLVLVPRINFFGPDDLVKASDRGDLSAFSEIPKDGTTLWFTTEAGWIARPKVVADVGAKQATHEKLLEYAEPELKD